MFFHHFGEVNTPYKIIYNGTPPDFSADDKKFKYPYAAHNVLAEGILGPSSRSYSEEATITDFPNFPVPPDNGIVIP